MEVAAVHQVEVKEAVSVVVEEDATTPDGLGEEPLALGSAVVDKVDACIGSYVRECGPRLRPGARGEEREGKRQRERSGRGGYPHGASPARICWRAAATRASRGAAAWASSISRVASSAIPRAW